MEAKYWADEPYWTEALELFYKRREEGTEIVLDLKAIEEAAFAEDSPAIKLMDAMCSVSDEEGMEGCRGAPRVMLALLMRLEELSRRQAVTDNTEPGC